MLEMLENASLLENVNRHQHFYIFTFLASKCLLTQVRLPYESNQRTIDIFKMSMQRTYINRQDGNSIPLGDLSSTFSDLVNQSHNTLSKIERALPTLRLIAGR